MACKAWISFAAGVHREVEQEDSAIDDLGEPCNPAVDSAADDIPLSEPKTLVDPRVSGSDARLLRRAVKARSAVRHKAT